MFGGGVSARALSRRTITYVTSGIQSLNVDLHASRRCLHLPYGCRCKQALSSGVSTRTHSVKQCKLIDVTEGRQSVCRARLAISLSAQPRMTEVLEKGVDSR